MKTSVKLIDLNAYIECKLCKGYLIDATTIVECLHSFCKTCIVKYLEGNKSCPTCDTQIHKTKPLLNIRSDPSLQDIVYKIVPGLFKGEMQRRSEFYAKHPEAALSLTSSEDRGILSGERVIYSPDDKISISIEYLPEVISYSYLPLSSSKTQKNYEKHNQRRFLECEGGMKVLHLKKWLRSKYELKANHDVEVLYKHDALCDEYTMMDLAYIYSWRRNGPLSLYYKITDVNKTVKRRKIEWMRNEVKKKSEIDVEKVKVKHSSNNVPQKAKQSNSQNKRLAKVIEKLTKGVTFNNESNNANSVSIKVDNEVDEESLLSFSTKLGSCTKESSFAMFPSTPDDWRNLPFKSQIPKVIEQLSSEPQMNGISTEIFQTS